MRRSEGAWGSGFIALGGMWGADTELAVAAEAVSATNTATAAKWAKDKGGAAGPCAELGFAHMG